MADRITISLMLSATVAIALAVTSVHAGVLADTPADRGTLDNNPGRNMPAEQLEKIMADAKSLSSEN